MSNELIFKALILPHCLIYLTDAVVLLDRCQGGAERLQHNGIKLHSILKLDTVLETLKEHNKIDDTLYSTVKHFLETNHFEPSTTTNKNVAPKCLSYSERKQLVSNGVAKRLLDIMEEKKTNLAFSADISSSVELLKVVDLVGPYCCMVKTHVDVLDDFNVEFVTKLRELSQKHNFVIFEDRKFADIGNTVVKQYSQGIYRINDWAELTNAHVVPGKGVVDGLESCIKQGGQARACLLIAQMSSEGALTDAKYAQAAVEMAKKKSDYVIGFISTSAVCTDDSRFLHFTPGVSIQSSGDSLGQQYTSPHEVIKNRNCDVIIVGRGIYKAEDPAQAAKMYQEAGYAAYLEKLQ